MPSLKDTSGIPANGKNLIVVASVGKVLHFRIFDAAGNVTVNTDETKLAAQAQEVEKLRMRLESLWSSQAEELTKSDKDLIIAAVSSIVNDKRWTGQSDPSSLRLQFTDFLARRGDTGKLLLQIEELKKVGYGQLPIQFFTACYHINDKQFVKARQILVTLQTALGQVADVKLKSRINVLLAQCYSELGEPEMQQNAYLQALSANPQDVTARLGWAKNLVSQGDIAGAIKEYRILVKQLPHVRPMLARLLNVQNQRRPESQRNWGEVNELINYVPETEPQAVEQAVLRAEVLFAQGNQAAARDELGKARVRFPKSVEIRIAQANLARFQGRVDEVLNLLSQAKEELGDQVDLRLEHARLWASRKGLEARKGLMDLSRDVEKFSPADRKRLLNGLAFELKGQQDLEGASQVWARLAAEHPADIDLRLNLLSLALQNTSKDDIEKYMKQIEEIEGSEGLWGRYNQVRYLMWQAQRANDKDTKQAIQDKAHVLLEELLSRRSDWSVIPLASAELAEQELAQSDLKGDELREKEETIIGFYRQAIKLGKRSAPIVRRTVHLLFKTGHGDTVLELLNSIPMESELAGEERLAARFAVENRDFQHAEQIARKAIQANPDDFQERLWLVKVLLESERQPEAVKEFRDAVALSPGDPDRWVELVAFFIFIKQPMEAEKAIREAEAKLPPSKAPMALATCCERMGRVYEGSTDNVAELKKWNDQARTWYEKAEAAEPENLSIKRRLTEFFLRSKQTEEAQQYLETIRKQRSGAKNAEAVTWANRALALILATRTDRTQLSRALTLFEPDGKPVRAGQEGKVLEHSSSVEPEDLRVLSRVLDMQKTAVHRKRAIEILETLAKKNLATSEDRYAIAHLYEAVGDWPKSREKYRELILRTRTLRGMETLDRRLNFLEQFAISLLQHREPGDKQALAEAQDIVDEIKYLQPTTLAALILQVELHVARNEADQAVELIQANAKRPDIGPQVLGTLAGVAEKANLLPLAEQLYIRLANLMGTTEGKLLLAVFLGRHDRVKEGLDICEPFWVNTRDVPHVSEACINILFDSDGNARTSDPAQPDRVASWFEQAKARAKSQKQPTRWLLTGLGNVRERQGRIPDAIESYRLAIQADARDGVSLSNLACLNNLAWLLAFSKDEKQHKEALDYANRAISLAPDQPDFLDTRGMIHLINSQPKLALEDFLRAVAIDPSKPAKDFHLAQAYLAVGDKERAKQSLDTAKTKGLTPSSLHVLERGNYESVFNALGSP